MDYEQRSEKARMKVTRPIEEVVCEFLSSEDQAFIHPNTCSNEDTEEHSIAPIDVADP